MYTDTHSACGTAEVEFYNPIVNVIFCVCMCVHVQIYLKLQPTCLLYNVSAKVRNNISNKMKDIIQFYDYF